MSGGTPFQTKFTVGLLTIDPCPPDENIHVDVTHQFNDVNAQMDLSPEELAAQEAIKARKQKKRAARQKARSASPVSGGGKKSTRGGKKPGRSASPSSRRSPEEEEAAKKRLAELKRAKAEKAAELARKEEELQEEKALEEFAKEAEKAEKEMVEEQQKGMDDSMDESMPRHELFELKEEVPVEDPKPQPTRKRPSRRISMFPATRDNVGLNEALRKYGNSVPFDWEEEKFKKEHVNLKHTSTISKTYGWEKPDWAKRSMLKKTMLGDVVKQGQDVNRYSLKYGGGVARGPFSRRYVARRHSLTGRSSFDNTNQEFSWRQPDWARRNILRTTEFGEAARMGVDLAMPTAAYKTVAQYGGSHEDLGYEASFASLNASRSNSIVVWDKPSWAVNPSLRPTSTGNAVRLGADLSLPAVGIREVTMGDESARHRIRSRSGDRALYEKSPNSSFADLDYSEKAQNIAWEKPSWTNMTLKRTSKGDRMKTTGTLANPVTPRRSQSER